MAEGELHIRPSDSGTANLLPPLYSERMSDKLNESGGSVLFHRCLHLHLLASSIILQMSIFTYLSNHITDVHIYLPLQSYHRFLYLLAFSTISQMPIFTCLFDHITDAYINLPLLSYHRCLYLLASSIISQMPILTCLFCHITDAYIYLPLLSYHRCLYLLASAIIPWSMYNVCFYLVCIQLGPD